MYNVRTPNTHFFQRSGISTVSPLLLISLYWYWFWVTQCETEEEVLEMDRGQVLGFFMFVCSCSLVPTWYWYYGWAHTGHCCCWCWGYGGSCWVWALRSGCLYRWGSHAELRCQRTPGSQLAERRIAVSGHEHPDSSRPHHTVGENGEDRI